MGGVVKSTVLHNRGNLFQLFGVSGKSQLGQTVMDRHPSQLRIQKSRGRARWADGEVGGRGISSVCECEPDCGEWIPGCCYLAGSTMSRLHPLLVDISVVDIVDAVHQGPRVETGSTQGCTEYSERDRVTKTVNAEMEPFKGAARHNLHR